MLHHGCIGSMDRPCIFLPGTQLIYLYHPAASYPSSTAAGIADSLVDGCIKPEYYSLRNFFGEEYADKVVKKGLISKPKSDELSTSGMHAYINMLWRGNVGSDGLFHVPYEFSPSATFPADQRATIESALQDLSDSVGIINIRKKVVSDTDYITITSGSGCWSYIGQVTYYFSGSAQELNLQPNDSFGYGCVHPGTIQHEMMHALGFFHEQSRPDRDDYVTINFDNIRNGTEGNFEKSTNVNSRSSPYDYGSVMHYGEYSFSTNYGVLKTIDARGATIGQRDGASDTDLVQIRLMYQCENRMRDVTEYTASPCSADCKCSIGMAGCNGNDNFCHGDAVCSNNQCSAAAGAM